MILKKPYYEIESEIDGEKILRHIEKAARTCYKSEGKIGDFEKSKKFVKGLVKNGHLSTLEHYSISVRFVVDRSVSHELVRHRLASFSQESTRYCNYSKEDFGNNITCIIPSWIQIEEGEYHITEYDPRLGGDLKTITWAKSLLDAEYSYFRLLELGWKPEQARSVLPNSLKTEIVMTCNIREMMHILTLRTSKAAYSGMREIMIQLGDELKSKIPVFFDDLIFKE